MFWVNVDDEGFWVNVDETYNGSDCKGGSIDAAITISTNFIHRTISAVQKNYH